MRCAEAITWRRSIVTLGAVALLASCSTGTPPPAAAVPSGPGASTPTPTPAGKNTPADLWATGAGFLPGTPDAVAPFACPAGGHAGTVWGAGPYTADSSVCTAAVHAGLITFEKGGSVTVRRAAPQPVYGASIANGVTTSTYGAYANSFLFQLADGVLAPAAPARGTPLLWSSAVGMARTPGARFAFWCPPAGTPGTIWGTDVYTLDSAPCTAGAHTGTIPLERGGTLTVEVRAGAPAYTGSLRHGVQSTGYGKQDFAFVVVGD